MLTIAIKKKDLFFRIFIPEFLGQFKQNILEMNYC